MTIIEREYFIQSEGNKNFVTGKTLLHVGEQFINFKYAQREMKSTPMNYAEMRLLEYQEKS